MNPLRINRIALVIVGLAVALVFVLLSGTSSGIGATRTLKVKVDYTGAGPVDEKHKIFVFLFDSPDFVQGAAMPIGSASATSKSQTVSFESLEQSRVYVTAIYDKGGGYDGRSGPPPSGSPAGMYSKTPGTPEPIDIPEGKTVEIELTFDDSFTLP